MSTKFTMALALGLLAAGCNRGQDDTSGDIDTAIDTAGDTADTDTDTDTDSDTDTDTDTDTDSDTDTDIGVDAPEGFAFCAAGGKVTGADYSGIICLGPMDLSGETVYGSDYTWQAGPIYILAP